MCLPAPNLLILECKSRNVSDKIVKLRSSFSVRESMLPRPIMRGWRIMSLHGSSYHVTAGQISRLAGYDHWIELGRIIICAYESRAVCMGAMATPRETQHDLCARGVNLLDGPVSRLIDMTNPAPSQFSKNRRGGEFNQS